MKTLVVYATKYGCTEKCAKMLAERLAGEVDLYNLKDINNIDLVQYEKVIIGGSVYIGRIRKEISEFCSKNLGILKEKKLGLFICCMRQGETAETELKSSFPEEILAIAAAKEYFGGEFIFKNMSFMDRFIAKKVSKSDKDTSTVSTENINKFAEYINNA